MAKKGAVATAKPAKTTKPAKGAKKAAKLPPASMKKKGGKDC